MDRNDTKLQEPVVFSILNSAECSKCKKEIPSGDYLVKNEKTGLCMKCGGLNDLEFLPRGDVAMTRRAGKYSSQKIVVLRFNKRIEKYERLGILVETEAIRQAKSSCESDSAVREKQRKQSAKIREKLDKEYLLKFAERIRELYPRCPKKEATKIAQHAGMKHSGRVGRSAAAKRFESDTIHLAVWAYVRHNYTNYDEALAEGLDRLEVREWIRPAIEKVLRKWKKKES